MTDELNLDQARQEIAQLQEQVVNLTLAKDELESRLAVARSLIDMLKSEVKRWQNVVDAKRSPADREDLNRARATARVWKNAAKTYRQMVHFYAANVAGLAALELEMAQEEEPNAQPL